MSRIMSDVEGVRNLIGTGLVDFVGGLMTAVIMLVVLLRISAIMTGITAAFVIAFAFALKSAFTKIRPIFRERGKITAEVTGRLTESLGGVRVIKGYHAEEREAGVFAGRRQAASGQCNPFAHGSFRHEPFRDGADGNRRRAGVVRGRPSDFRGSPHFARIY